MGLSKRDKAPLVILTATVTPHPEVIVRVSDPQARRGQYLNALKWWLKSSEKHGLDLLVVENSGECLELWPSGRYQVLSLSPPHQLAAGKGMAEAGMLAAAIASASARDRPWIAKCTGRLTVRNLGRIFPRTKESEFVSCRISPDLRSVDSRLVIASRSVWDVFLLAERDRIEEANGVYLEHALALGLHGAIASGVAFEPFSRVPRFAGRSGTSGMNYQSGLVRISSSLEDLVNSARNFGRRHLS